MVKCPRCGYENATTSVYCDNCAYLLSEDNAKVVRTSNKTKRWNVGRGLA